MVKWIVGCLSLLAFIVHANEEDRLHYSAFGTLGLTLSDSSYYGYRNSISADNGVYQGDIDFSSRSLLGFQLDAQLNEQFDVVLQTVFKDMPEPELERYLSMAFLRYSPSAQWNIRVGRIPPNLFLITEFKNVGYAYPWAVVPQEVYGLVPYQYIDGTDISYSTMLGDSTISATLFAGIGEAEVATTRGSDRIDLQNIFGLSFSFERGNWLLQARYSQLEVDEESYDGTQLINSLASLPEQIWPNARLFAERLRIKGEEYRYSSVGGQWHLYPWILSAEVVQITADSIVVPKINSGYVSAAYHYGSHTLYGLVAGTKSKNYTFNELGVNANIPGVQQLIAGVLALNNLYASNQHSLSLGWRWEASENIATSVQWSHTKVNEFGGTLWFAPENSPIGEAINTTFANVSFAW